jgi:hypothetical protein
MSNFVITADNASCILSFVSINNTSCGNFDITPSPTLANTHMHTSLSFDTPQSLHNANTLLAKSNNPNPLSSNLNSFNSRILANGLWTNLKCSSSRSNNENSSVSRNVNVSNIAATLDPLTATRSKTAFTKPKSLALQASNPYNAANLTNLAFH